MSERINQGYKIIKSVFVGNLEFVLGENPNAPNPYVTWQCKGGNDYYWGKYMNSLNQAKQNLNQRVNHEIKFLKDIGAMPSKLKHRHEPER